MPQPDATKEARTRHSDDLLNRVKSRYGFHVNEYSCRFYRKTLTLIYTSLQLKNINRNHENRSNTLLVLSQVVFVANSIDAIIGNVLVIINTIPRMTALLPA